ncbi:MAG: hypothetical protein OEY11_09425 [Gammaproteobacteria bacterium]|nr:hypothetical protein [Gammaproteobacteria bacterium]
MKYQNMSVLFVLSLTIIGCASPQLKNTQILEDEARKQALSSAISPQQAFEEAEELLKQAKREELELYAPLHMKAAEKAIEEARFFIRSKDNEKILQSSFKAKKMVFAGVGNKALVNRKLSATVEQFARLKTIASKDSFADEYASCRDDVIELFSLLESGDVASALKEEPVVLRALTKLEIKTLYKKYVGLAEDVLEKAKKEKADELAVTTYKSAEAEIRKAGEFVKTNYLNISEVERVGNLAIKEANHAYFIAREVAAIKGLEVKPAEKRALYIESLLNKIAKALGAESGVGHSITDQAGRLADKAGKKAESMGQIHKLAAVNKEKVSAVREKMEQTLQSRDQALSALREENQTLQAQLQQSINEIAALKATLAAEKDRHSEPVKSTKNEDKAVKTVEKAAPEKALSQPVAGSKETVEKKAPAVPGQAEQAAEKKK